MARRRKFLTGSQRAEFEHIYGPLPVDSTDARFVLVTPEEEALIQSLPAGVPVRHLTQNPAEVAGVAAHFVKAAEAAGQEHTDEMAGVKADLSVLDTDVPEQGQERDEPTGSATTTPAAGAEEPVGRTKAPRGRASDGTKKA